MNAGPGHRRGMERLLAPCEYRHLRAFGVTRMVGGGVAAAAGVICLLQSVYGWAAFFLAVGTLNLLVGCWELIVAPESKRP